MQPTRSSSRACGAIVSRPNSGQQRRTNKSKPKSLAALLAEPWPGHALHILEKSGGPAVLAQKVEKLSSATQPSWVRRRVCFFLAKRSRPARSG